MTSATLETGVKTFRRRRALEPYWLRVHEALSRQPRGDGSSSKVSVDGIALLVEPWVAARLDDPGYATEAESERTDLLRQSLALWLKCANDVTGLRRCVQSGSGNLYALQAELMLDSSFGGALLPEFQDAVDALVSKGELEEARRFSKFQHQVRFVVQEIQQAIAESNGAAADAEPVAAAAVTAPQLIMEDVLRDADMERAVPRRRPRPPAPKPSTESVEARPAWRPTKLLIVLDVIALVVWLVVMARGEMRSVAPRALDLADFPNSAAVKEFVVRSPAVYATVDREAWERFDESEKESFLKGMGNVLLTSGYGGMLLKSTDGRIVGAWFQNGGARLIESAPATAVAEGPVVATPDSSAAPAEYNRFVP